jgi:hypothetical protein
MFLLIGLGARLQACRQDEVENEGTGNVSRSGRRDTTSDQRAENFLFGSPLNH